MNWFVHENITQSVDRLLQKQFPYLQSRKITKNSKISIYQNKNSRYSLENRTTKSKLILNPDQDETTTLLKNSQQVSIYSYSISINKVQQISESFGFSLFFTKDINKATAILALKSYINENQKLLTMAKSKKIPIYTVKKNTAPQIAKILTQIKKLKVKII
jgi:L-lactate utilization protein LutB